MHFAIGEASKTFVINTIEDSVFEGDHTLKVRLYIPNAATLGTPNQGTLTIEDNDSQPSTVSFNPTGYSINEGDGTVTLTVQRTGGTTGAVTVNYATVEGTASPGTDYTSVNGTLTFASGETLKTITVPIVDDAEDESNETFRVNLNGPSGGSLGANTATVTIIDNDVPPASAIIAFRPTSYSISEGDGSATLTLERTGNTDIEASVTYSTQDGTAKAPGDYTTTSGTLTFAAGETSKTITVPIIDDSDIENNESFSVNLASPGANTTISGGSALVWIGYNDGTGGEVTDVTFGANVVGLLSVGLGESYQATLYCVYADGSLGDVTNEATWTSANPRVVKVTNGLLEGISYGQTRITATYGGRSVQITAGVFDPND